MLSVATMIVMEKAIYRIIDANFNRAREAIRVMEDFCRFGLNSARMSGRCKKLRHDLSAAICMLDEGKLITSRDTLADVGTTIKVEGQLSRGDIKDCTPPPPSDLPRRCALSPKPHKP